VEPPLEPLLEPFELGAFAFEPDDFERDDLGFAARFAALGLAALAFVDFGFAALAFAFACDFGFDAFDLLDEPARFGAARFFALLFAIFLSPRECPYWSKYPIHWRQITLRAAKSA
jgi:hypothetical protein